MEQFIEKGDALFMAITGGKHTIEEVYALPDGERAELIKGELYMMATPTSTHQQMLVELLTTIYNYIKRKKGNCRVFPAPFAVLLHNDDSTYLDPDISVICDNDKLDKQGCHGAPDWVIEIVSPSSKKLDYAIKLSEYQTAGVREYWIVDTMKKTILVYHLEQDSAPLIYCFTDKIQVGIYEDLEIDFSEIELLE